MHPRKFALVTGLFFLVLGIFSFVPALSNVPLEGLPPLRVESSYGLLFGMFSMNIVNKIILVLFGIAGLVAYRAENTSLPASIHYSRWVFAVMGALSILGMIPDTNTLFGLCPLYGNEIWANGVYSLLGAYFGFTLTAKAHQLNEMNKTTKFQGV